MCSAAEWCIKQAAQPILGGHPWADFASDLDVQMRELNRMLAKGDIRVGEWQNRMAALIRDGHIEAHELGQMLAGVRYPNALLASSAVRPIVDGEGEYLAGFADKITNGGYDLTQAADILRLDTRCRLYIGKMRGSSGIGFVDGSPPGSEFVWHLGGVEDHCEDCPLIASLSPFSASTLYTTPGQGDTPCLGNCKCFLSRVSDSVFGPLAA